MDLKYKYASITGKKISPFAQAITEIFNFSIGKVIFWATLYLLPLRILLFLKMKSITLSEIIC
jgi:hypothetical protein